MIESALSQIGKNKYHKELIDNKIKQENIIKIPIVFAGKEPFINTIKAKQKKELKRYRNLLRPLFV